MRKLKVYGWSGWRNELPPRPNGSLQSREIVAAANISVARALGARTNHGSAPARSEISETGNRGEIAKAMSRPGAVFFRCLDAHEEDPWIQAKENV